MVDKNVRASIRLLVFGPIVKSLSFWLEIIFIIGAAFSLVNVWRDVKRTPALSSMESGLFLLIFILVFASYIYFTDLVKLRREAQKETDEEKRQIFCRSADSTFRMFCYGTGVMAVCLTLCLEVLSKLR